MSRRKGTVKREVLPDSFFNNSMVGKLINVLMLQGKKSLSEKIVYNAFSMIRSRIHQDPLNIFHQAIENVSPKLEVKSRRIGGATYQVPVEVKQDRRVALALRWLIFYSRTRGEKTMDEKLAAELIDASQNKGITVKKKEDTHKMADANRAFNHYRY